MYYCFDCGRFMCPGCFNAHEVLKKSFQGHKVTPLQDFKTEDYEALLRRQPFCSQQFHEREIARFFCSQCQVCICQICIVTDHENHKVVGLDKAAHEEKDNIMSDAKLIKEMESELREVIKQFEETISKLKSNMVTAKLRVKQSAEQMIADIREREREALESIEFWIHEFTGIPDFRFSDIYHYLVGKDGYDEDCLRSYKSPEGFRLFVDGHVKDLKYYDIIDDGHDGDR
ncbi:hypothetical protein pdam_00019656 [Pocillopora damicornis]|uniref:B box-type domain-containing protein n=1 Tax=Pocillopora damicornis TaxID=46731 RepID=A0A3M6TGB0_POCDA|nr:hypothetical protein pdam_00019656 [Pocillopora damicornis]